jgi:hypothetical protein
MEFFIPGLVLFLVTIAITAFFVPRATPMIAAILSLIFLTFGVYQHYTLFAEEYRHSTWQDGLKIYAPAIMIVAIILFIMVGMLGFFTNGEVPVPSLPNVPAVNNAAESISDTVNDMANTVSNVVMNTVTNAVNNVSDAASNVFNTNNRGNNNHRNNNRNHQPNLSRSYLETI